MLGHDDHYPLRRETSFSDCKVCCAPSFTFDVTDFNKHCSHENFFSFGLSGVTVPYKRCMICGCIFTNFFDDWRPEDFVRHIYNADYELVDGDYKTIRPHILARDMASRWKGCEAARVLDYGSGSGAFAAEIARLGFQNVKSYDPFSEPVEPSGKFDIITCFEVIEHSPDPQKTLSHITSLLDDGGCVIISQTLQPENIQTLRASWWYIAPRNGHICTFSQEAFAMLAQNAGLTMYLGENLYAFARPALSDYAKQAMRSIGRPFYFWPLYAPGESDDEVTTLQWHAVENGPDFGFRWTKTATVSWLLNLPHYPATLRLAVPFVGRITEGMLEACMAIVGDQSALFNLAGGMLTVDLSLGQPARSVIIKTPQPISPVSIQPCSDDRLLGLAIRTPPARALDQLKRP